MIDPESIRLEIVRRLPINTCWSIRGVFWDFDFSRSHSPLRRLMRTDVSGDIEDEWTRFYLFGEEDYASGGGASPYLGVHRDTGEICGIDVERDGAEIFLLNSNVDKFIRTFQKIDAVLRDGPIVASGVLSGALMEIDPDAFQRSDWRDFSNYIEQTS